MKTANMDTEMAIKSVHINKVSVLHVLSRLNLEKMYEGFLSPRTTQSVHNNEESVLGLRIQKSKYYYYMPSPLKMRKIL